MDGITRISFGDLIFSVPRLIYKNIKRIANYDLTDYIDRIFSNLYLEVY